ncbi:polymer-forming cytoskeletal protein [Sporocytophaga myxococcoides]|uniref:polymer-forming cytoskeletal protein n=1 Tax=Sporocytophaga myxococcoides TaxID=153721 RepID=UPI0004109232|nr:polymer-forming cytoskeletal protein [Sporocytophaga myxococcoides]
MKLPSLIIPVFNLIILFFPLLSPYSNPALAGDYKNGDVVIIDTSTSRDQYVSSKKLVSKAVISGDLYAAAQSISIEDTIKGDLVTAAETIDVKSVLNDDFRAAARNININSIIKGDVILFANEVYISKGSIIHGDLTVYAGSIFCEGVIKGNLIIKGGTISLGGNIDGNTRIEGGKLRINAVLNGRAEIAAQNFTVGSNAFFKDNVRYWKEGGPLKVSPKVHSGRFDYDNSLAAHNQKNDTSFQSGFIFLIWHIFFAILMFIILTYIWPASFQSTGVYLAKTPIKSLGYGLIYFILFPFAIFLLFISIIGIPIAVLLFFIYLFSISCGLVVTSLAIANMGNYKLQKHWSKWMLLLTAIIILILLHVILLIPFIGFLIIALLTCAAYGGLLLKFMDKRNQTRVSF